MHFPLALLSTAYALDAISPIHSALPNAITTHLPPGPLWSQLSYYALSAGLLASIPAIMSGVQQGIKQVSTSGLKDESGAVKSKFKTMAMHALVNDAVVAGSAYVWYCKRQGLLTTFAPETWMVGVQILLGLALVWAGHLGGALTYNYGMGLNVAGSKKNKAQ